MKCKSIGLDSFNSTADILLYHEVYSASIDFTSITSNSVLMWALKKTGQTNTISFQFIIMMSISDLLLSTAALIRQIMNIIQQYNINCWTKIIFQIFIHSCSLFSFIMVALIALDRYLHMKYLERYPSIVTKTRGYILAVTACLYSLAENIMLLFLVLYNKPLISHSMRIFGSAPIMISICILYFRAIKSLRTKVDQLSRNVITQTRALSTAATRITVCLFVLSLPLVGIQVLELANRDNRFMSISVLSTAKLFCYATFTSNGFWSAFIFMSLNRPVRLLLRRCLSKCTGRAIGVTERAA